MRVALLAVVLLGLVAQSAAAKKTVYVYRVDIAGLKADVTASGGIAQVAATSSSDWTARWRASFLVDPVAKTAAMTAVAATAFHGTATVQGAFDTSGMHYTCGPKSMTVTGQLGKLVLGGRDLGQGRFGLKVTPALAYNPGLPLSCSAEGAPTPQQVALHWDAFAGTQSCIFSGGAAAEYKIVVPVAKLGAKTWSGAMSFKGAPAGAGCTDTNAFFGPFGPDSVAASGSYHVALKLLSQR
jgi:hypothetical protein